MTKKDIVRKISETLDITQILAKEVVQMTFDLVIEAIEKEKRIELRNFGVFEIKERKPRKARNPKTGEEVMVGAKRVVIFKPGKEMGSFDGKKKEAAALPEDKTAKPIATKAPGTPVQ